MQRSQEPQMTLHNYIYIFKQAAGLAELLEQVCTAPAASPTHQLQQQNPTFSSRATPEESCSDSTPAHCKTSPALPADQGKAAMQHDRVITTHKYSRYYPPGS